LETCARTESGREGASAPAGTAIEIAGGKFLSVQEAGLPFGTAITVRDLFFNIPARRKFLRSEATELSQIASLVTHYALAHPEMQFELHSASNAMLQAPPVKTPADRVYQIFGKETLDQLIPVAAMVPLERLGLPQPPPWRRVEVDPAEGGRGTEEKDPGELRLHGFVSKPEIQKLNRNSIFVFVNGRLIRDRLVQHALTEAYRNIIPPTVFPVVLLFLEMPCAEVDVNVHPSKTEVRFRQQSIMHDFVRDSVRATLMKSRPVPQFTSEIAARATAGPALTPGAGWETDTRVGDPGHTGVGELGITAADAAFVLRAPEPPPITERIAFNGGFEVEANAAIPLARFAGDPIIRADDRCAPPIEDARAPEDPQARAPAATYSSLASMKALGQVRDSFILAVNGDGLWIVDQHAAHERVLFEQVVRQREAMAVEVQRLLMPIILELAPAQQAIFAEICDELRANGFDAEPFGSRTIAVKTAPAGLDPAEVEGMLHELLEQLQREEQVLNLEIARRRIAASIACHAAIKVNMPLEPNKMEWLLDQLAKTACPMSCPHGRPTVLRYSVKEIQRAFKRI
ncbi:MAG TPA: DNA mismatch repair endonuclease MutL, partial [Terriglobales bacterium]|nr:DNA mismatch repair endonuclease MutL [Terriglobales bacterium]